VINEKKILYDTVPEKYMFQPNDIVEYTNNNWNYIGQDVYKLRQSKTLEK
jgi:hypothetical protein